MQWYVYEEVVQETAWSNSCLKTMPVAAVWMDFRVGIRGGRWFPHLKWGCGMSQAPMSLWLWNSSICDALGWAPGPQWTCLPCSLWFSSEFWSGPRAQGRSGNISWKNVCFPHTKDLSSCHLRSLPFWTLDVTIINNVVKPFSIYSGWVRG